MGLAVALGRHVGLRGAIILDLVRSWLLFGFLVFPIFFCLSLVSVCISSLCSPRPHRTFLLCHCLLLHVRWDEGKKSSPQIILRVFWGPTGG